MKPEHPIANPGDDWPNLYLMWAGAYGATRAYVWAENFESAFETFTEWLDDNAPGLLCDLDENDLREAADALDVDWNPDWPDDSAAFYRVVEHAEADLTIIGHTTLKHGHYIPSWEWGGDDVTDEATIEAVRKAGAPAWAPDPDFATDLVADLRGVRREARPLAAEFGDDFEGIDVRLRIHGTDEELLTGDPQYDTDHRGFWGSGRVGPDDSDAELFALAESLIAQVQDAQAESEVTPE